MSFFLTCTGPKKYFGSQESICTLQDLITLVYQIIHFGVMVLVPLIVALTIVYGAFLIILYGTNSTFLEKGRTIIFDAVIGIIIVWGAWATVNTVFWLFNFQLPCPWYQITC